jgi:hypothetical protein
MQHGASSEPRGSNPRTGVVTVPRWHRALTAEDVETARSLRELHMPSEPDPLGRRRCASALHLVSAPSWPCDPARWCEPC